MGVLVLSTSGQILQADHAAESLFRYEPGRLVGQPLSRLLQLLPQAPGETQEGQPADRGDLFVGRRSDGTTFPCDVTVHRGRLQATPRCWTAVVRDASAQIFREQQQCERAKVQAVETLVTSLTNDLNNALAVISGALELASSQGPTEPASDLRLARHATRKAARLVRRLIGCTRPMPSALKPLDPARLVEECAAQLARELPPAITVIKHYDHGDWLVSADAEQMTDVLLNLGYNARDAMPAGGQLTFATSRVDRPPAEALLTHRGSDAQFVCLAVTDTGCGIPPDILPRIFDPFFTTKPPGRGAGLGLAMVYGILRQHGAGITVESSLRRGTTFRIYLRRAPQMPGGPLGGGTVGNSDRQRATTSPVVLVVDDEPDIRKPIRGALEQSGFEVLEAGNGAEALDLLSRSPRPVALVLLDVIMPGLSGWEVLTALKARTPSLPVLVMSGYAPREGVPPETVALADAFLNKPSSLSEIVATVRALLGERPAPPQ
jgi:PAS domain S-box-containing protein